MNLPTGKIIQKRAKLAQHGIPILELLFKHEFNGYLVLTTEGKSFNEGMLLFEKGSLKGAMFETLDGEEMLGEDALNKTLNAFASTAGIIDVSALSKQQAELVLAFQEKMILTKNYSFEDLKKKIPKTVEKNEKEKKEDSKLDIFKKLGLLGMEKK